MTHDEQKRVAQMVGRYVRTTLNIYARRRKVPQPIEIDDIVKAAEEESMAELSLQRIAREAGEYVAGSGMVN